METHTFGAWLRGIRAVRRLKQKEVARELDLSTTTLCQWECEHVLPVKIEQLFSLAEWAQVAPQQVFELVAKDRARFHAAA